MLNARPGSKILKLVKEVQSDKLNISTQWLRGDYGPCSRSKVAQNLLYTGIINNYYRAKQ